MTDALIYPGRLNALNGEPGGGKLGALLECRRMGRPYRQQPTT